MPPAPLPAHEDQRLNELHACRLLDTKPDPEFDQIVQLAAYICQTPIALVSLIDRDRQWFKAKVGLEINQTAREVAFCAHAILQKDPLIISDSLQDERFADNPLVVNPPHFRFYAGVPLVTSRGLPLGTLCVLDYVPRRLEPETIAALKQLADLTVQQIEQRRSLTDIQRTATLRQPVVKKRRQFLTTIATGFGGAAAILIMLGVAGQRILTGYSEISRWQSDHYQILEHLHQLDSCLHTTTIAQAEYLLTQQTQARSQIQQASACIEQELAQMNQFLIDSPEQMSRVAGLKPLINTKLAELEQTLAQSNQSSSLPPAVGKPAALVDFSAIEAELDALQEIEQELIASHSSSLFQTNQTLVQTLAIAIICNLSISALLFWVIYRETLERKRTESFLEQERDFSAALIDTVDALIIVLDAQGRIVRFNHVCEEISGYTYAEVCNRQVWDMLLPPEEIDAVQSALTSYLKGERTASYENHWLTRSGERRLISWSATTLTNLDGSVAYLIGTGTDITERRRVEQRRNAQYALTRILAQSMTLPEAMTAILAALCQKLDWDLAQFWSAEQQQLHLTEIWHRPTPDFAEFAAAAKGLIFSPGEGLSGLVWQQKEPIWVANLAQAEQVTHRHNLLAAGLSQALGFPIWGNDRLLGVITLFVTSNIHQPDADLIELLTAIGRQIGQFVERKLTEADIQRQHIRAQLLSAMTLRIRQSLDLREILSTTVSEVREYLQADRVLFYRFDPEHQGTVIAESVDPAWRSCLGSPILPPGFQILEPPYQPGQVSMLADVEQSDLSPAQRQLLAQFQVRANLVVPISEDAHIWGVLVAHQCSEPRQWQSTEVSFLLELANQVGLAIAQAHLLVQETQQRQQLAQQNLELQQARSAAEQAKQIAIQSCKAAEQATQVKSAFLATISHEIRTPLNALIGISELLSYTKLDAQQQEFVNLIRSSGDTLLSLINNVLDFSKLEAKTIELEILEFDLWECLEEVVGILSSTAYGKGLEMSILVEPGIPTRVRGDLNRIRQVLTNLIGNAIKFTAVGEVIVQVCLTSQSEFKFVVRDTGIGIAESDQPGLFQPFTQVDASTTRKYGGTGLGLAICRQVVECMGGTIGLDSQVGQGSTFWFTVPLEPAVSCLMVVASQTRPRILVIAAHPAVRAMIRSQTRDWQMQVDEVTDLQAGLQQLQAMTAQSSAYVAVLIDVGGRDDRLSWQMLRQVCPPQTRLVGLIAPSDLAKMQPQLDREQIDYLVKPVRRSRLYDQLVGCPMQSIAPVCDPPVPASSVPLETANPLSQLRILLVEDNEVNQLVTIKQLRQLGYQADVAANGQDALMQLAQTPYDLVLMDCQMPIMDGFMATAAIRKQQVIDYQPVIIAITANATLQDRQSCLTAGMDDYLSKPIQQEDLRQMLVNWGEKILQRQAASVELTTVMPTQPARASLPLPDLKANNLKTGDIKTGDLETTDLKSTSQWDVSIKSIDRVTRNPDGAPDGAPDGDRVDPIPMPDSIESLLDWNYLRRLSNGNPAFERELLQTLVASLPSHIHNLKTHWATGNFTGLRQEAHYIKGASSSIGIQGIVQPSAAIEQLAQQQHLETMPTQIQQLEQHFNRIVQFLANYPTVLPGSA